MRKSLTAALFAVAALAAGGMAQAQDGAALAKSSGCMNCHAVDTKKMATSFKDIAAKYKGKADAQATLTTKLAEKKGHPEVKATGADLTAIVKWILAM